MLMSVYTAHHHKNNASNALIQCHSVLWLVWWQRHPTHTHTHTRARAHAHTPFNSKGTVHVSVYDSQWPRKEHPAIKNLLQKYLKN